MAFVLELKDLKVTSLDIDFHEVTGRSKVQLRTSSTTTSGY